MDSYKYQVKQGSNIEKFFIFKIGGKQDFKVSIQRFHFRFTLSGVLSLKHVIKGSAQLTRFLLFRVLIFKVC
jgi:hypothetical protein